MVLRKKIKASILLALLALGSGAQAANYDLLLKPYSDSDVKWSSLTHSHEYGSSELQAQVRAFIDLLLQNPKGFESMLKSIPLKDRKALAFENLDSRTDTIDLLSVELKGRLENTLKGESQWDIDRSTLWSLAKFRLKRALDPSISLNSSYAFFRKRDLSSTEVLALCAEPKPNALQELGGISFEILKGPRTWSCGPKKLKITEKVLRFMDLKFTPPDRLNFSQPEKKVTGMVGLTATVEKELVERISLYLKWVHGFRLVAEKEVNLKEAIAEALVSEDLNLFSVDMPHANSFSFSAKALNGYLLEFFHDKEKIRFRILLPALRSPFNLERVKKERGVDFTLREMQNFVSKRKSRFQLVDFTCFSSKYLKNWRLLFERQLPFLLVSQRGHAAESAWEVLQQTDLLVGMLRRLAMNQSEADILRYFEAPDTILAKGLSLWNGVQGKKEPYGDFKALTLSQSPLAAGGIRSLYEIEDGLEKRIYAPAF